MSRRKKTEDVPAAAAQDREMRRFREEFARRFPAHPWVQAWRAQDDKYQDRKRTPPKPPE